MKRATIHASSFQKLGLHMPRLIITGLSVGLLSAQAAAPLAFDRFAGRWAGTLEYQDYGADRRVKIPVSLNIRPNGAVSAAWNFQYDDFGTTVSSLETHRWKAGTYTVTTLGQPEVQRYTSRDFSALISGRGDKAVLMGTQVENAQRVEIRRTITLGRTTLITLTETRAPGSTFAFRNRSSYIRIP
ncbi:VCBS domain-containing protein [Deinococcus aquatilis]|uniref:VCBS domain-containing protein n=1 Tax=Deinococcus aquatilis TaxID=519440 RepID=UPI001B7F9F54|nr:VCBS domain-containing protein [Deinococcus aquatilis]